MDARVGQIAAAQVAQVGDIGAETTGIVGRSVQAVDTVVVVVARARVLMRVER